MITTRLVVTGGRLYRKRKLIWGWLDRYHAETPIAEIGEGGATGVDRIVRAWAIERNVPYRTYEADWDRYGDRAGTIRNGEMLDDFKPDRLLVFPGGTGTRNCSKQAHERGIVRTFYNETEDPFEAAKSWG